MEHDYLRVVPSVGNTVHIEPCCSGDLATRARMLALRFTTLSLLKSFLIESRRSSVPAEAASHHDWRSEKEAIYFAFARNNRSKMWLSYGWHGSILFEVIGTQQALAEGIKLLN